MLDLSKIKRPANLPQWENPPLDEVAISVQFNDIPGFKAVHYGLLAERFRIFGLTQYEDKAPINPSFEVFGKRVAPVQFQLQAVDALLPRVWYMSEDKHRLVQVQPDKFVYNWRKVEGAGDYPRFDKVVLPEFLERCQAFEVFVAEQRLPALALSQCELSYFNIIEVEEGETYHDAFTRIFRFWAYQNNPDALNDGASIEKDSVNLTLSHVLKAADGSPLARIHTNVAAAERRNQRVIRFALIFRAPWTNAVNMPLMQFFAEGREAIARLFDAMITDQMHTAWGRTVPHAES
jgi:uncharacterized protein (TIGR04255 family)